jgi:hypothetical protein
MFPDNFKTPLPTPRTNSSSKNKVAKNNFDDVEDVSRELNPPTPNQSGKYMNNVQKTYSEDRDTDVDVMKNLKKNLLKNLIITSMKRKKRKKRKN